MPTPIADQYREVAKRIFEKAQSDRRGWTKLAYLADRIGHRLSGSKALERAIDWAVEGMKADGHENVHTEKVMVPHWVRGSESGEILAPVRRPLTVLGLGMTVGTGKKGVTGEVVVIDDFKQMEGMRERIKGRIVLFNKAMPPFHPKRGPGYGVAVPYRSLGPSRAADMGAIATLVRSVTSHSLNSPHTGAMRHTSDRKIPAAAVTVEDAAYIARLAAAGDTVRVRLTLGAKLLPDAESANVIGELKGREKPDEIVLIGAHLDSWDVGQGAHDDGSGCVTMMQALTVLRDLGLRPRRTIRVVLFTNEENGLGGARAYAEQHKADIGKHVVGIESDTGSFKTLGFVIKSNDTALKQLQDIITLLAPIGATRIVPGYSGADLMFLEKGGMPGMGLLMDMSTYFDYHHTDADTLDKVNPEHLAENTAAMAVIAYVIADMPDRFAVPSAASK